MTEDDTYKALKKWSFIRLATTIVEEECNNANKYYLSSGGNPTLLAKFAIKLINNKGWNENNFMSEYIKWYNREPWWRSWQ